MFLNHDSDQTPLIRRTATVPADPPHPADDRTPCAATLTCLESQPHFEKLRSSVSEEFAPPNFFLQSLADDVAEEFWMKKRLDDITNQALSLQIEDSFAKVTQTYPNVDSYMRTVLAWREVQNDPAFRAALAERTRAGRSFQSASRHLAALRRRK